jgi:hypothetical protein
MLQQTQTSRVIGPWTNASSLAFPTPTSCADAPLSEVTAALGVARVPPSGQGPARRRDDDPRPVRRRVPNEVDGLRRLTGVGRVHGERRGLLRLRPTRRRAGHQRRPGAGARGRESAPHRREARWPWRSNSCRSRECAVQPGDARPRGAVLRAKPRCDTCPLARTCRLEREGGPDPAPRSAASHGPRRSFLGSTRQLRGVVLRHLREGPQSKKALLAHFDDADAVRGEAALEGLVRDGLVRTSGHRLSLVGD